jgi:hypothetical protein
VKQNRRVIDGWVFQDNIPAFFTLLSQFVGYSWDDADLAAIEHGLTTTDLEAGRWYDYGLYTAAQDDLPEAEVHVALDVGSCVVFVRVWSTDRSERFVGRVEALLDICSSCSVELHT